MPADRKAPGSSQPEDLVTVIDEFHAMWNTQNVDGILSFFTEDSVITLVRSPREAPVSYHGEAAIRTFVNTHLPGWGIYARSHYQINNEPCGCREYQRAGCDGWASTGSSGKGRPSCETGRS